MIGFEGMSYDRVMRLISQLPVKSRFMKKFHKVEPSWDTDYLLAGIIDCIRENSWLTWNVHFDKKNRSKLPERFYRPGDKVKDSGPKEIPKAVLDKLLKQKETSNGSI